MRLLDDLVLRLVPSSARARGRVAYRLLWSIFVVDRPMTRR
jgi:hypothetical protein